MKDNLSARLRLGDPTALEAAMDRYAAYAAKIISAYLNHTLPAEDMEEVLSDVFLALWNSRDRLRGDDVKPYLAAIARNAARQKLRRFHPTEPLPEQLELEDTAPPPERQLETEEQSAALRQAIDTLPTEDRTLFLRVYYLGQTVEEVAAVTGQSASTLRVRLHRGRKKLRQILTNTMGEVRLS